MLDAITLLYVEDDQDISEEIAFFLKRRVKKLLLAQDGEEGLALYVKHHPDIVVTDIQMPRMNGLEMSTKIRDLDKEVPIVIISAYNDTSFLNQSIELGIGGYITKPVNLAKMVEVIHKAMEPYLLKKELQKRNLALQQMNKNLDTIIQQKTQDLKFLYHHDTLTSLKNIVSLLEDINKKEYTYLLLLDIANFAYINKQYGKEFGDRVLIEAAQLLNLHINEKITLYKVESDRFVFLLEDMQSKSVVELCEQIHSFFDTHKIEIDKISLGISFNIGVASFEHKDRVLVHAEYALDISKDRGARFYFFYNENDSLIQKNKSMIKWLNITKEMIEEENIIAYYQPILDVKSNRITKFEVLARGVYNSEVIPPIFFIEPATRLGLITSITKVMIHQSFHFFRKNDYEFSINISERDLYEDYLYDYLQLRVKEYGIKPSRVTLEILENITVCIHQTTVFEQLKKLKSLGFKIAIDDFGTENANFARLMDIEFDYIKLDGIFIQKLHENKKQQLIVRSIVGLAKVLGVKTIAEFVEDEAVCLAAKECGVDYMQGYYFGKPSEKLKENVVCKGLD